MKKISYKSILKVLFISFFIFVFTELNGQSISCQELFNVVTSDYDYSDETSCYGSSMLARVGYYEYNNMGFVVAYIKDSEYDFSGDPYIFCGISSYTWNSFKSSGMTGSWGESFHEYIMDNKCNCY